MRAFVRDVTAPDVFSFPDPMALRCFFDPRRRREALRFENDCAASIGVVGMLALFRRAVPSF